MPESIIFYSLLGVLAAFVIFMIIPFISYTISRAITRGQLHAVRDFLHKKEKKRGKKDK